MSDMFPAITLEKAKGMEFPLASFLFGHRMRTNQTNIEYLIEFLQVMLAEKDVGIQTAGSNWRKEYFPTVSAQSDAIIKYRPETRIALKRFIFFPHSKPEGKAVVDQKAYEECVQLLQRKVDGSRDDQRKAVAVLQDLLFGFNATTQSRSWFDMNMLPICPEVILPEGMGVKTDRKGVTFECGNEDVDKKFSYTRYTYMCRGGEIYYLHLLDGINRCSEACRKETEARFKKLLKDSYPQFSKLSDFIQNNWDVYMHKSEDYRPTKQMTSIPAAYSVRSKFSAEEINTLLSNDIHPFEKIQILADGILMQLLRIAYSTASNEIGKGNAVWLLDLCHQNAEMRKLAAASFLENELEVKTYIYQGYEKYKEYLKPKKGSQEDSERAIIKEAHDNSYRLFRKLGKELGLIIPIKGGNMRLSLSERIVKFLVLSIVAPGQKITLDYFLDLIYQHYGIVIDDVAYKREVTKGTLKDLSDYSVLSENKKAMIELLKACGFLRDLSDATAIVENPFDREELSQ